MFSIGQWAVSLIPNIPLSLESARSGSQNSGDNIA